MGKMDLSRRSLARLSAAAGLMLVAGGMLSANAGCGKADTGSRVSREHDDEALQDIPLAQVQYSNHIVGNQRAV